MKQTTLNWIKNITIVLIVIYVNGCSNDDNLGSLDDVIYVRHKNADMPAYIYGNATEKIFLITLHGGPGGVGLSLRRPTFINRVEKEYAVVYFDQRGSGMSQGSYAPEDVNIDLLGEDIIALKNTLKAKYGNDSRFFLLGHSYGGTVGTSALLQEQDDFLGWIEIGGSNHPHGVYFANLVNHAFVANEQIGLGNSINYWESVLELLDEVDSTTRNKEDSRKLNSEAFFAEERLEDDGVINMRRNGANIPFEYNPLTALWNTMTIQEIEEEYFGDINFTERLSEITIPTLLMWGKYDLVVPPSFGMDALEKIGATSKELIILQRSGHSPMENEPELFTDKLLLFMEQHK